MEEQIKNLEAKIDAIALDVKKMKRYFLITFWVTIALVVLPIIGLFFAIPAFFSTYANLDLENINLESLGL